jgi:hypothetical protein
MKCSATNSLVASVLHTKDCSYGPVSAQVVSDKKNFNFLWRGKRRPPTSAAIPPDKQEL